MTVVKICVTLYNKIKLAPHNYTLCGHLAYKKFILFQILSITYAFRHLISFLICVPIIMAFRAQKLVRGDVMDFITDEYMERISNFVEKELACFGISPIRLGYTYILKAVTDIIVDDALMVGITKNLYPHLAKRYCTSAQAVERNIRSAIDAACKNCNDSLKDFLDCEDDTIHITNKEFIFKTVKRVKKHLEISNNDEY